MRVDPSKLLAAHTVLNTDKVEQFHAFIAGMEGHHARSVVGKGPVRIELRFASLGRVDIGVQYSSVKMTVESALQSSDAFLLQFPLSSSVEIDLDGQAFTFGPDTGIILTPSQHVIRTGNPGYTLALRIPGELIRSQLQIRIKTALQTPFSFQPLITSGVKDLLHYCLLMIEAIDRKTAPSGGPLAQTLEQGLVDLLLNLQPHTYSQQMAGSEGTQRTDRIQRVSDYIDSHFTDTLNVMTLARIGGCSVRALQATFDELCGMSPMEYLTRKRLAASRKILESAEPGMTVSRAARLSGFKNPARFAVYYRERYGELPSKTLERS